MFAKEKSEEVVESHFGVVEVKRFFQWILGCTYAKKTFRTRVAEMFHFADAPHIVVYERSEERPWYWMVGIITAVLLVVLSLYYTVEAGFRSIRKFMYSVLHEAPQSTVSTPRCLSPTSPSSKKSSPQTPKTPDIVRQKVAMNEPVNCVFIRPSSHKKPIEAPVSVPNLNSEEDVSVDPDQVMAQKKEKEEKDSQKEKKDKRKSPPTMRLDEVQFDASSNFNIVPTMAPSPHIKTNSTQKSPSRKSTGSDVSVQSHDNPKTSNSECDQINEWVLKQIAGCTKVEDKRSNAGVCVVEEDQLDPNEVCTGFMDTIQQFLEAHLGQNSVLETTSNENISEMSMLSGSVVSSLIEIFPSYTETSITKPDSEESEKSVGECIADIAKQTTGNDDDVDIILNDSSITTNSENECYGSVQVKEEKQKVMFRWTDDDPNTIDSVSLTGSFFGWNMNMPMKRTSAKSFEVCLELPNGTHDYLIKIFRFD